MAQTEEGQLRHNHLTPTTTTCALFHCSLPFNSFVSDAIIIIIDGVVRSFDAIRD
jgi:hypothetical protein